MENYKNELFGEFESINAQIEEIQNAIADLAKAEHKLAVKHLLFVINDLLNDARDVQRTLQNVFDMDTQKFAQELHNFRQSEGVKDA